MCVVFGSAEAREIIRRDRRLVSEEQQQAEFDHLTDEGKQFVFEAEVLVSGRRVYQIVARDVDEARDELHDGTIVDEDVDIDGVEGIRRVRVYEPPRKPDGRPEFVQAAAAFR